MSSGASSAAARTLVRATVLHSCSRPGAPRQLHLQGQAVGGTEYLWSLGLRPPGSRMPVSEGCQTEVSCGDCCKGVPWGLRMGPTSWKVMDEMQDARREAQPTLSGLEHTSRGLAPSLRWAPHLPETTGMF